MLQDVLQPLLSQPVVWFCLPVTCFAAFLMGFTRSAFGGGGFVVSPLILLGLGGRNGLAVLAPIMIFSGLMSAWQHRKEIEWPILNPLLYSAIFGTTIGGLILWGIMAAGNLESIDHRVEIVVGGLTLLYVLLISLRDKIAKGGPNRTPHWWESFSIGSAVGISQTVANSGSPLLTVFFLRFHIPKERFVAAQVLYLLAQNIAKLVPFILLGILHFGNFGTSIILLPLVAIGGWAGQIGYKRFSEKAFFGLYICALILGFIASVILIVGRMKLLDLL
ncbi:sulfite exporter TauE/SafE family protein [Rubellicoccus peritrichatus]|uniref:Probable membrane transporter protein n=1 Tax=Rubellicoccus peritrichatus TaxID=3080537 RepID=A0AAQ3QX56_9BACT|nr:sulfite exporter TauE/SafE family protein [Puniceicoccus sp. CR14]WOO42540.1 sulfite exporter TauE/SafE family protein [Puniceicoccus sp. CR14]